MAPFVYALVYFACWCWMLTISYLQRYLNGRARSDTTGSDTTSCSSSPTSSPMSSPMSSPHDSPVHEKVPPLDDTPSSTNSCFEYKSSTLPAKLDLKDIDWDDLDDLLQVTTVAFPLLLLFLGISSTPCYLLCLLLDCDLSLW